MKILYVIAGYGPEHLGYEISRELAQEISARGHSYSIFALARARDMRGRRTEAVEEGVPIHRAVCAGYKYLDAINALTVPLFKYPWFLPALYQLVRYLRQHPEFEIVIAEGAYPMGALVYLATRLTPRPYIVNVAGGDFIANEQAQYGYGRFGAVRWMLRRVLRHSSFVRPESPYGAMRCLQLGCPPEKLALVQRNIARCTFLPHGADSEAYRARARVEICARLGITAPRLILTVGRLLPIKGFDDLLRGLPQILAGSGNTHIVHVGPNRNDPKLGDYQAYLERLAQELGIASNLTFAGAVPLEQVRDFLAAADVVAIPSVEEGGNKIVMESAAVATPFVATATAGTPDWAREWGCGLIVPPRAPDQMAAALIELLNHPTRAREMGRAGMRFAEQFRTDIVADRILKISACALAGQALPTDLQQPSGLLHPTTVA